MVGIDGGDIDVIYHHIIEQGLNGRLPSPGVSPGVKDSSTNHSYGFIRRGDTPGGSIGGCFAVESKSELGPIPTEGEGVSISC